VRRLAPPQYLVNLKFSQAGNPALCFAVWSISLR
jgi:hypothetical protein